MNLKEIIFILRKTSFRRAMNVLKIFISYFISKLIRYPVQWGQPLTITVEPTTACNLRCPECPSGLRSFNRETGSMKYAQFLKFVDSSLADISFMIFYFQGEPFINADLLDMIKYASSKGVYTMSSTNAHFLDNDTCVRIVDSGLDRLIISIDGTNQETYQKYRIGGSLDKVIQGIKCLTKVKKQYKMQTPLIFLQFIVFKHNEHQMKDMRILASQLEADHLEFKTAQVYYYENGSEFIPETDIYSRYRQMQNGTFKIKNNLLNECWRMWQGLVITWNGNVVPCCFDKDAEHTLGSLQTATIRNIWKNKNYFNLRKKLLSGRKNIDICKNCTEGTFL